MHLHMSKAVVSYAWIYNEKIAYEIHEVLKDLNCTNKAAYKEIQKTKQREKDVGKKEK